MGSQIIKYLQILLSTTLLLFYTLPSANSETLKCTRVVDGNTIILSNGKTVRLIGVASLATKHPSKPVEYNGTEESVFTRKMVEGKEVRLEFDQQPGDNRCDDLFAYVFLTDGTFLNAEIIKQGYGRADTSFPFKYMKEFSHYEKEARKTERGMWAQKPPRKEPKYTRERYMGAKNSTIYHLPTCALIRKVNPLDRRMFNSVKKAVDAGYVPCKVCKPPYYK